MDEVRRMPRIIFSALSFLRKPLQEKGIGCCEAAMSIADGATPDDLLAHLGLAREAVEAVFINGRAGDFETPLKDGDRVALLPPGTPGPHRMLLRIKK
jgi:molybdopterin converting factor small subunit